MEVKVRLREPLSGQDMQTSTERWLVINHTQVTLKVISFTAPHSTYPASNDVFFPPKVLV